MQGMKESPARFYGGVKLTSTDHPIQTAANRLLAGYQQSPRLVPGYIAAPLNTEPAGSR